MTDNGVNLSNDDEIAETLNIYFCNIAKSLSLLENPSIQEPSTELFNDPVKLPFLHQNKMTSMDNPKFSFRFVSLNETQDGINKLNSKKALEATDVQVKIVKENNCIEVC